MTPTHTYRDLGAPNQLTKAQVAEIKSKNSGAPIETRTVKIDRDGNFEQQFDLRENDAVLIHAQAAAVTTYFTPPRN